MVCDEGSVPAMTEVGLWSWYFSPAISLCLLEQLTEAAKSHGVVLLRYTRMGIKYNASLTSRFN